MSERLITALVVNAFLLFVVFESATGQWFLETYPTAGHVAVWLGILGCALGTWVHLKRPDNKSERDKLQIWFLISFFAALLIVAVGADAGRLSRRDAAGLFLLFAIWKVGHHIPPA